MEVTEIRIKLSTGDGRLQAFCSVTFDGEFVVRDMKVIEGQNGLFLAMPCRKVMAKCSDCRSKNDLQARYCNACGRRNPSQACTGADSRLFSDIAHPINAKCRSKLQSAVLNALQQERLRAQEPGYVCKYDDFEECAA